MTGFDVAVIWLNCSGAVLAALAAGFGARHDDPRKRPLWVAVAVLAAIYAGSYVWLLAIGDVIVWSKVMRGVSLVVWPLIWATPPIWATVLFRRDQAVVKRKSEEVAP